MVIDMNETIKEVAFQMFIAMFAAPDIETFETLRIKGHNKITSLIGSVEDEKEYYINNLFDGDSVLINTILVDSSLGKRFVNQAMLGLNLTDLFSYFASDELRVDASYKEELIMKNPFSSYGMAVNNLLDKRLFLIAYKLILAEGFDTKELVSLLHPSFKGEALKLLLGLEKNENKKVEKDEFLLSDIKESVSILENKSKYN